MPQSDRRGLLRWIFLGFGLFLLFGRSLAGGLLAPPGVVAEMLHPGDAYRQTLLRAFLNLTVSTAAILCLITARGLRLGRGWSRATGMCACVLLLPMFPLLTLAGAAGLWVTATKWPQAPREASKTALTPALKSKDYWIAKRRAPLQQFIAGSLGVIALAAVGMVRVYARSLGMTSWDPGFLCLPVLLLFDVMVHEMGHVTMAWALHNRLRMIHIGPFTFRDFGHGYQFHFDWRRLFAAGGFVSSASLTGENLRKKLVAEVFGGPVAALLAALVSAAVFLSLPGTPWQAACWMPGYLCVIFLFDGVVNLIPVGYSDGSMLLHLILWTPAGRLLIGRSRITQIREDADAFHGQAEYAKEAELWSAELEEARQGGEQNAFAIAFCHERLAHARHSMKDWPAAEAESRRCLEFGPECAFETVLLVNSWWFIQRAAFERHHAAEVGHAYAQALAALEARRKGRDRVSRAVQGSMIASAHFYAGDFEKAAAEAAMVLRILPAGSDRLLLRAEAGSILAQAEFALGAIASGQISTAETAGNLRSPDLPPGRRNLAWDDMADFGEGLWRVGEPELAVDLIREAIAQLEAGGATVAATRHRIRLASILRQTDRHIEAWQCLPELAELPDSCLRGLLTERTRMHLAAAQPLNAIADCDWLLHLGSAEPVETALAESLLAEAHLEAGNYSQAGTLSRKAADVLGPWGHCETATCLVTMALAQWLVEAAWTPEYVNRARLLIESDSLLHATAKRRFLEVQTARVERHRRAVAPERVAAQVGAGVVPAPISVP